jgi:hypothetical protein
VRRRVRRRPGQRARRVRRYRRDRERAADRQSAAHDPRGRPAQRPAQPRARRARRRAGPGAAGDESPPVQATCSRSRSERWRSPAHRETSERDASTQLVMDAVGRCVWFQSRGSGPR